MNMVIYEILLLEVICPIKTYITYFQTFNNKCYILVLIFSHYETIDLCSCATLLKFLSSNHWCDTQIKFLYIKIVKCCQQLQFVQHKSICTTLLIKINFRIFILFTRIFVGNKTLTTHKTHVCSSQVLVY